MIIEEVAAPPRRVEEASTEAATEAVTEEDRNALHALFGTTPTATTAQEPAEMEEANEQPAL
ncbi:MAG: hypothetical protein NVV63_12550 [Opitutus sp.]|nr:hypothetical protein [Opitutus sp.]